MNYRKLYLWVSAIGLIPIALSYGAAPHKSLSSLFNITVETTNHMHIFRAIMGLYFAMTIIWVLGAMREEFERPAILAAIVFMGGLAGGRAISIWLDGWPHFLLTSYGIVEIAMAAIGIMLLNLKQTESQ